MSRIKSYFETLKASGKKALIPYITAGDPTLDATVPLMHSLVEAGADVIELGVPFSDPMADGPAIQLACERALAHNTSLKDVLNCVRQFRETNAETPIVLMGYLNPVEIMGYDTFAQEAEAAGVDGVLLVDLPPEEADSVKPLFEKHQLDSIFLLAPTTSDARTKLICEHGSGYVYYVSVKGVTGSSALDTEEVARKVAAIQAQTDLPVGVGFGIKDGETAAQVAEVADGVIVGSVLVNAIADSASQGLSVEDTCQRLSAILRDMRQAMDKA
ncbi:tryptophan synthase subunit alpha [Litoribrevibacter albus]|uniref:Tryptophan synthase alpha chain n=1 Tax=Litoribrevibacter albus TaxID=1473156 RepID=A0AA37SA39_9GAMM|nr:tryptophan synthase subunit alpha [Litoribrevibacter albus]GLQ30934.1 tryptophan synthase alpha chain [Litoribrevibacter albus]